MSLKDLNDRTRKDVAEVVREGAALDGAQAEGGLAGLPRVLRYALMPDRPDAREKVAADVATLAPEMSARIGAWATSPVGTDWVTLAADLDAAAVRVDQPALRALADVVRLRSMRRADVGPHRADALRVIAAMTAAAREAPDFTAEHVSRLAKVDTYVVGWTHLVSGARANIVVFCDAAHEAAYEYGREATSSLVLHAADVAKERLLATQPAPGPTTEAVVPVGRGAPHVPAGHLVVCPALASDTAGRTRDVIKGHEHVIGKALPMAAVPDLAAVRRALVFEYPYAIAEVDRLLSPLVGRATVHLPPTIVVGPPGSGKSRLLGRLSEELGVHCWRTDGSRADGGAFGGTDRRWHSVEPCHPLLAVSRARAANPFVLVDEVDKSATRTDHGRLWDSLLPFLERETASAHPDPALQADLDLSAVSFLMTANSVAGLPAPLVDRCRIIRFPEPQAADLGSLLPALVRGHARDLGLDPRWFEPLDQDEVATLRRLWRGGSVRRLRALLDVLLRGRERLRPVQ